MASGAQASLLRLRLSLPLRRGRPRSRLGTGSRGSEQLYGRALRVSHGAGDRRTTRLTRRRGGSSRSTSAVRPIPTAVGWLLPWPVRLGGPGGVTLREISSRRGARAAVGDPHGRGPGWLHLRDESLAWRSSRWRSDWRSSP